MERLHLQIYFPFHVVALSAVRCERGAAGKRLLTPVPSPTRGEMSAGALGPRRASIESGVFSWETPWMRAGIWCRR
jgi:hypothetical protein